MRGINEVIKYWKQSVIKLNEGVGLEKIELLEKKVNFKFPKSFKEFYSEINGFRDSDWNENMFTIYSVKRIEEEYFESKNTMFIPFCDYLINSHQIGFSKAAKGIYINYQNHLVDMNDKVAETFEQSLVEIIKDSDKIY